MNAAILALMLLPCLPAAADPAESVVSGGEALDRSWPAAYPWYDPETDGVRRIELERPRPPQPRPAVRANRSSRFVQWLLWIVIILLLAVLIFVLIWTFLKQSGAEAGSTQTASPPKDEDIDRVEALPFPVRPEKGDLFDQAREHYLQGDFGQAVIFLFSYQLIQLDRHQVIRLTRGKTNRQYLREVGQRKTLRGLLGQTMVAFEDVFFGNHSLDQGRFEAIWSRMGEFQALASEGAV